MITKNGDIEKLKRARELLITIDMINGFVKDGSLAAPSIMRVVKRQIELLKEAKEDDTTGIVFIRDSHPIDSVEFKTYVPHCIEGSMETEVIDELKEYEEVGITYFKNSTNLIFAPNIQSDLLAFDNLKRVRLMGCLSEVCVENGAIGLRTFFDQFNRNVEVYVHADAIDTFDAPGHDADEITRIALENMKSNGIKVLGKRL